MSVVVGMDATVDVCCKKSQCELHQVLCKKFIDVLTPLLSGGFA